MAEYTPDPKFYDRQIKAANKELKKYTNASYNTTRRGYVVDGRVLSQEQLDAGIANINDKIASLEADKKKFGKYGPDYGEQAQSNALGEQFIQLYDAASAIEVTDFDSSLQSVKAWKAVENFVKQNKGIVVAVDRTAIVEGERGRSVRGTIRVAVDPTKDPTFKESITNNVKNAVDVATAKTEEGTIESREVVKGSGAAATRSTQKTVINPVELERRQKALDTEVAVVTAPPKVTPAATAAGKSTTQTGMTDEQKEAMRRRNKVGGGFGATAPATPTTPEPPKVPGGVTQRTGRGRVLPSNWEAKFREMFPGQAWYLDVDPAKYPDVKKIVQDAVINRAWETPEAQARFLEQFKSSSFYKELESTQKVRQIKAVVGDLGFDTVPFNQFLTKAMNLGWDGDTLKFEAYKEAFRKDDTGAYVNPTAVERVRKSNDYLSVSSIGKAFFSTVSDETVQRTLMGDMTNEDVQRQQRELAKTKYAHLAPLLDQGLTLTDIGDTFRTTASQILEKDPNTIDMSQADYEVALNFGEPGQKRVMTNGEWERLLRTDKRYGWTKTENAKAEARQFVSSMVQAFGRVI